MILVNMKCCIRVLSFCLAMRVLAQNQQPDIHALLPLFERNTIAKKVLDMQYSIINKGDHLNGSDSIPINVHLVFDANTGKYYRESRCYSEPANTNIFDLSVSVWNEKEYVKWDRSVSEKLGFRILGPGVYEEPGRATLRARPLGEIVPMAIMFFFDKFPRTFAESVPENNPKLGSIDGDKIIIETQHHTFVFSKKTGALEKIKYFDNGKVNATIMLSNHVELTGVLIPLKIVFVFGDEKLGHGAEININPQTVRLFDEVEDDSIFNVSLPSGCFVSDQIGKRAYMVTTLEDPPQDVKALEQMLEQMLEQAEEQKATVEQDMKQGK